MTDSTTTNPPDLDLAELKRLAEASKDALRGMRNGGRPHVAFANAVTPDVVLRLIGMAEAKPALTDPVQIIDAMDVVTRERESSEYYRRDRDQLQQALEGLDERHVALMSERNALLVNAITHERCHAAGIDQNAKELVVANEVEIARLKAACQEWMRKADDHRRHRDNAENLVCEQRDLVLEMRKQREFWSTSCRDHEARIRAGAETLERMANDDEPPTAEELRRVVAGLKGGE